MVEMTELVEREEQLRQAEKMHAEGQFTGGVAHEFNNLLLVIVSNLETLLKRSTNEVLRQPALAAMKSAMRGSDLTRQLLALSRKQTLDVKPVDPNGLVLGMRDMLLSVLGETVSIETDPSPDIWPILSDAGQIESALLNLSLNARDAMPKGGVITITTANRRSQKLSDIATGDFVKIDVSDSGTGMTADVTQRAMDPFFTTKAVGIGTGLGLSTVFGFVEQSGGSVEIESKPGEGTRVKMYLPRAFDEPTRLPSDAARAPATSRPQQELGSRLFKGNVLVVEDDPMVRVALAQMLRDLGCHPIEAGDAETAMARLAEHPAIDLLFMDVVLPNGASGIEIANRAPSRYPGLKDLLSSGYPKKGGTESLPAGGGIWFLEKPYRAEQLSGMLADILGFQQTSSD